jgi:hypothetical protein
MKTANAQAVVIAIKPPACPLVFGSKTLATTPDPNKMRMAVPINSATNGFILFFGGLGCFSVVEETVFSF